ncbi:40s ribosomal protein s7 [Populus alba x Populus x berolinensis]|nr:40s ribosomal protein s7 [Populus alba x Populus x berolinensis]
MAAFSLLSLFHPNPSIPKMTTKPLSVLNKAYKMQVPYELKQGQTRLFHQLPSGLNMEVIEQKGRVLADKENNRGPGNSEKNPPLVFVHGSYHAAWCWAEHWLPFFSGFGFDSYAVSLLGQGESDAPAGPVAGSLQTHAGDVADFIQKKLMSPPVLLGHSFGGLIIQCYIANIRNKQTLEKKMLYPDLAGAVLVCSVPPSGNSGLVWRYLFSKPVAAFKVTRSLAAKAFQTDLSLCKETFFTSTMEDHLVKRYQALMKESSRMPLFDLRKLNSSLPVPSVLKSSIEVLVLGANGDFIVHQQQHHQHQHQPERLLLLVAALMFTTKKKIQKDKDAEPTEFEETVAQALFDLENTSSDLKSDLKDLFINSAVQIDVAGNRKAIVIYVPYRLRKAYRKVHLRLVRELEKKFSGKDVVLLATRRIVRPPKKGSAVQRPRSRTLTAVHEAMLEDLVYPAEIVGKRTRYRIDGSKISKIFLDPKERNNTEYKLESYAGVYRKLTGKDVVFDFPVTEA